MRDKADSTNLRSVARRYSELYPAIRDADLRVRKGYKVAAVLRDALQRRKIDYLLDIGCSSALLLDVVVEDLQPMYAVGIDLDADVLPKPTSRRATLVGDAGAVPVADESIDVIICNQTYEHVPDAWELFDEIKRILKPRGIVYFGAMNAAWPIEPHYHLPFIHWLPRKLSKPIMRLFGNSQGYLEKPLSSSRLRDLVSGFELYDYTLRVIADPVAFRAEEVVGARFAKVLLPIAKLFYRFLPTYLWVLVKDGEDNRSDRVARAIG